MQIHIEVVIEGRSERRRIATIRRGADLAAVDGLGLTLAESKDVLARLQASVVHEHADELVAANSSCGDCGQPLSRKGTAPIVYRTAFGKLNLRSRGCTRSAGAVSARAVETLSIPLPFILHSARILSCCTCKRAGQVRCPTSAQPSCSVTCCRWAQRRDHPPLRLTPERRGRL